ncbi:hypothetical protein [Verrucomicrobium sp. BvORR034]|uniref:hypothetical protein n=1 Tax=Verrucomicrobium sp. BvORR034 TaxID=1396418 RepID=UPI0006795C50|nr:hypothetical protein [Verrucomicrobium sp. BvORR034]
MLMRNALLLSIGLALTGPAAAAETLYNNIELPDVWPPRDRDASSLEPMRVPYLQHPPQVIAIDVGRQLFVDDFLVETTNLKRTFHTARKYEGNPVFKPETPRELAASSDWEKDQEAMTFLGQGGVFYDPAEKHFKMYYNAGWRGPLALATSTDMHRWERPELGLAGGNTLLPNGLRWTGAALTAGGADNSVWFDLDAKPEERVKYMTCWTQVPKDQRVTGVTHTLHVSDGARKWSDGVPTGHADDYCPFSTIPFARSGATASSAEDRGGGRAGIPKTATSCAGLTGRGLCTGRMPTGSMRRNQRGATPEPGRPRSSTDSMPWLMRASWWACTTFIGGPRMTSVIGASSPS